MIARTLRRWILTGGSPWERRTLLPGEANRVRIVDVDDVRLVIVVLEYPAPTESERAETQACIDSTRISVADKPELRDNLDSVRIEEPPGATGGAEHCPSQGGSGRRSHRRSAPRMAPWRHELLPRRRTPSSPTTSASTRPRHRGRQPRARRPLAGPERCRRRRAHGLAGRRARRDSRPPTACRARRRSIAACCSGEIDELRFDEEELDELSWSPIVYSYLLGGGLFSLLSREFAPAARSGSPAPRGGWRAFPPALDAARDNLTSGRGRAVSAFHVEKAIETMPGVADLCRTAVEMAAEVDDGAFATRVSAAADAGDRGRRRVHRLAARRAAADRRRATSASGATCTSASSRIAQGDDHARRSSRRGPRPAYDEVRGRDARGWRASCGRRGSATSRCPTTPTP